MFKDLLNNDKVIAMLLVTIICCVAMFKMDGAIKDIILPAITGIFGIVTGMGIHAGIGSNNNKENKTEDSVPKEQ